MTTKPFYKPPVRIVLTGGPGAGKTAVLELAHRHFCNHVEVLPEAAGILFSGGFPRRQDGPAHRAAQRAIFHVQSELESLALARDELAVVLCDRGTVDGVAYWPGAADEFLADLDTSMYEELSRYHAVIHLRVPTDLKAYRGTSLRRETHQEALDLDARLLSVWAKHPRRVVLDGAPHFLEKAQRALSAIAAVSVETHDCADAA